MFIAELRSGGPNDTFGSSVILFGASLYVSGCNREAAKDGAHEEALGWRSWAMPRAKVSAKGWVVIPRDIRKKYGLKPGKEVDFVDLGKSIHLVPVPDDPVAALYGMLAGRGPSATRMLVEEHRKDREREEAEIAYWMGKGEWPT